MGFALNNKLEKNMDPESPLATNLCIPLKKKKRRPLPKSRREKPQEKKKGFVPPPKNLNGRQNYLYKEFGKNQGNLRRHGNRGRKKIKSMANFKDRKRDFKRRT